MLKMLFERTDTKRPFTIEERIKDAAEVERAVSMFIKGAGKEIQTRVSVGYDWNLVIQLYSPDNAITDEFRWHLHRALVEVFEHKGRIRYDVNNTWPFYPLEWKSDHKHQRPLPILART